MTETGKTIAFLAALTLFVVVMVGAFVLLFPSGTLS
jgi:hypothetical protein